MQTHKITSKLKSMIYTKSLILNVSYCKAMISIYQLKAFIDFQSTEAKKLKLIYY